MSGGDKSRATALTDGCKLLILATMRGEKGPP